MPALTPNMLHFTIAWRRTSWVVPSDAYQIGGARTFDEALAQVRRAANAREAKGKACELLVRDEQGQWKEWAWPPRIPRGNLPGPRMNAPARRLR
ncbi:MAG: hypothetical protein Q8Q88_23140 [Phenylobacterium sp.]|uniref:hypothetical protein n=1 Tax=Phenylobacterium sp. TaxID=1871053 RepID=UPI002736E98C|nr:hypothetical protein [Phenylobacterium sp.]MDP3749933.1 hypothetical protein [Phenylobacterium sp.]